MVNIIIITTIFIIIVIIAAGFVAQQFYTVQKAASSKPKTLIEKMKASGIGALDTDRFKEIVMSTPDQNFIVPEFSDENAMGSVFSGTSKSSGVEVPDDDLLREAMPSKGQTLNLEGKDLQTIYAEYLTAKNMSPFDVEPDFKLGVAYLKFAQYEKSQNQFKKVIEAKPDFPGVYYYLGEAYRCNGQFYEAMQSYKVSWEMEFRAHQDAEKEGKT